VESRFIACLPCLPQAGGKQGGIIFVVKQSPSPFTITDFMNLEKTEIWITTEKPLQLSDGRAIRGFFGNLYKNRPEFHGHKGDELVYKHPLIQYKVLSGSALIVGLKEGAYLLKAIPRIECLEIYFQRVFISKQDTITHVLDFGATKDMSRYSFVTPWVGLNEQNYGKYIRFKRNPTEANALINRILVGNLLSMSKSLGYVVKDRIRVISHLEEGQTIEAKKGVKFITFKGKFESNFVIPDLWGIGKFSSRGFGTIKSHNGV